MIVQYQMMVVAAAIAVAVVPSIATAFLLHTDPSSSSSSNSNEKIKRPFSSALKWTLHMVASRSTNPVKEGFVTVCRHDQDQDNGEKQQQQQQEFSLAYRIVRPMSLSSMKAAPIIVLHGGPSLPANYLYPLEDVIPYRSIVFYDQLGCGKSDQPTNPKLYSIDDAVDDLQTLIAKLGIRRFHLYGQSFGGILAYESLKRILGPSSSTTNNNNNHNAECLSVILSSAPTNVEQVEKDVEVLLDQLVQSHNDDGTREFDIETAFRVSHQCRVDPKPQSLVDAYEGAGSVWRGTDAISDYKATPIAPIGDDDGGGSRRMPSALVMRGEFDFVSNDSVQYWKECWNHKFVRFKTLDGCAHHGLLEQPAMYGEIVDSFFAEYD